MTEVEALLSVDAGRVPAGVIAFRARDREKSTRIVRIVLAACCAVAAVLGAFAGVGREFVALLLLGAGIFGVLATPDEPEEPEPAAKPGTLLLTPTGLIVRDVFGLRCWRWSELRDVRQVTGRGDAGLLIICRDGTTDFVDTGEFERGESLWALIRALVPQAGPAADDSVKGATAPGAGQPLIT